MIDKAIAHLTKQAMMENNPAITKIEEHLVEKCTDNATAEKLLDKSKSLRKLYEQIKSQARKKAVKNVAVLSDEEVYKIADEYYGIQPEKPDREDKPKSGEKVNILDFL